MLIADVGDVLRLQAVFTNSSGGTADPTTIALYLRVPTGSVGTYTYASGAVSRQSQGTYYYNGTASMAGYYNVRWVADGAVVTAEQSRFFVRGTNT